MKDGEVRDFGRRDKIGYMFGDFGNDFTFIFASSFLMVFYTKVLGISGGMVGTLFLVARFVDAFTDVTMGRIVDAAPPARDTHPPPGRRASTPRGSGWDHKRSFSLNLSSSRLLSKLGFRSHPMRPPQKRHRRKRKYQIAYAV